MTQAIEFDLTLYPDPVLRKPSEPVAAFDEELRAIVAGMFERMRKSNGVGLAAPQVGLKKRILVLNPTGEAQDDLVLVTVEAKGLGPALRWEESRGGDLFPHLYGPLPINAVKRTDALPLGADGAHRFPPDLIPGGAA